MKPKKPQPASEGVLAQTYMEALRLAQVAREGGASREEAQEIITKALKEAWPKARVEPWHYYCEECSDTGWQIKICTPETPCGRPFTLPGAASDDYTGRGRCGPRHTYAHPCYCARGRKIYTALFDRQAPSTEDELTKVGKAKPRPMTRFGR